MILRIQCATLGIGVKFVLDHDGRVTPFKDKSAFVGPHPDMTFRKPMSFGHKRAAVTLEKIEAWFKSVHAFFENEFKDEHVSLLTDPRRIFNADESGFPLAFKPRLVLTPTGAKNVFYVVTNTKTRITVMASFNAFSQYSRVAWNVKVAASVGMLFVPDMM